jgi:S-DNA-T family DNA segregation ATPase FtsK/SpoIIIE
LHHGIGGILGDVMYSIATNLLAGLIGSKAGLAVGFGFLTGGAAALAHSIGVSLKAGSQPVSVGLAADAPGFATAHHHDADISGLPLPDDRFDVHPEQPRSQQSGRQERQAKGVARPDVAMLVDRWIRQPIAGMRRPAVPQPVVDGFAHSLQAQPQHGPAYGAVHAPRPPDPTVPPADRSGGGDPFNLGGTIPQATQLAAHGPSHPTAQRMAPASAPGRQPDQPRADRDVESAAMARRFAPKMQPAPTAASQVAGFLTALQRRRTEPAWRRPSLNLLGRPGAAKPSPAFTQSVLRGNARLLEDVLNDFGVRGEVRDIKPGPLVTVFELEPARGTKASRVIALADDIARSMSVTSVRIAAVPSRPVIGIELPNLQRETVALREVLECDAYRSGAHVLPLALGKSIAGAPVVVDLARMPHLLIAGTTGSGKSVGIHAMLMSLLFRVSPADCRLLLIDPKLLELSVYNGIPHLLTPVVTDPQQAVQALKWAIAEMEERYKRMASLGVRSIDVYNNRVRNALKRGEQVGRSVQTGFDAATGKPIYEQEQLASEPMPYIVIVVDELADLMTTAGKEIEQAVQRLAQMARAAGIHLIMATQRPSVDVVTGTIKANFPTRISFKVASRVDSRTILDDQGAEQLLGHGDMLYLGSEGHPVRIHGAYIGDQEVEAVAAALRDSGPASYVDGIVDAAAHQAPASGKAEPVNEAEDLYDRAVALMLRERKVSISYIQRRFSIGYNRAADVVERMERDGLVSRADATGRREILAGADSGPPRT